MNIVWSHTARRDLAALRDYIAEHDPAAARRTAEAILQAAVQLAEFPASGRPGRLPGTRELVLSGLPYILPYTVDDDALVILAVIHGARRWPAKI